MSKEYATFGYKQEEKKGSSCLFVALTQGGVLGFGKKGILRRNQTYNAGQMEFQNHPSSHKRVLNQQKTKTEARNGTLRTQ